MKVAEINREINLAIEQLDSGNEIEFEKRFNKIMQSIPDMAYSASEHSVDQAFREKLATLSVKLILRPTPQIEKIILLAQLITGKINPDTDEIINHLPESSAKEMKALLNDSRIQNLERTIAAWIAHTESSLSKIGLGKDEVMRLREHLTFLKVEEGITENELEEMVQNFPNLRRLTIESNRIEALRKLPVELESLCLDGMQKLQKIEAFPQGLTRISHRGCRELKEVPPALPDSLLEYNASDCPKLENLPALNRGLKKFYCTDNRGIPFPKKLNKELEFFDCSSSLKDTLPEPQAKLKTYKALYNDSLSDELCLLSSRCRVIL